MLTVHRAERADSLVGPLAELLATAPEDPFEPEVIAVPSRGVERWISQQLALSLGCRPAPVTVSPRTSNSPAPQHWSATCWPAAADLETSVKIPGQARAWSGVCLR